MDVNDSVLAAIGNTPLLRLNRVSDATGCEILGKAEFMNPGGSVKDRAALGIVRDAERSRQQAAQAESRRLQVGSGDRSQRIRTYNFPQGRITDHRVEGLTLYDLPNVMEGALDALVERLAREHQADELARLTENG